VRRNHAQYSLAWWLDSAWLAGYLAGGAMHLGLDIVFNGRITPYSIAAFYSFGYRLAHRFDAVALLGIAEPRPVSRGLGRAFFEGTLPLTRLAPPAPGA